MKQIFIGLIAISAITFTANAQTATNKSDHAKSEKEFKHHGKHGHEMMLKKLNLSDAQKQQLKAMDADFKSKMEALKKNDNATVKDFNAQKESLMKERKSQLESILTPEQKTQLQQARKDREGKGLAMHRKNMDKMKAELNLSDEQVSKMTAQRNAFKEKAEAIKNDQSLTQDQKKDQFMSLRKEQKENFKNILSADQQKKLEDRKGKRSMKTT